MPYEDVPLKVPQHLLEHLQAHLKRIAQPRDPFQNPQTYAEVQAYLIQALESFDCRPVMQSFRYEGRDFNNILVPFGNAEAVPHLVIGAHFDGVPGTPGADDNASGVAALLEVARALSEKPPAFPLQLVFFTLEEYGMLGSLFYAHEFKKKFESSQLKKIFKGMLSLEMIGYTSQVPGSQNRPQILKSFYPDTGNFLALVGDENSGELLQRAKAAFLSPGLKVETLSVPEQGRAFPEVRLSDHSPFWDEGLPALLVTDTSFFRNPHYHRPSDTLETLDLEFLAEVTAGVLRLVSAFR